MIGSALERESSNDSQCCCDPPRKSCIPLHEHLHNTTQQQQEQQQEQEDGNSRKQLHSNKDKAISSQQVTSIVITNVNGSIGEGILSLKKKSAKAVAVDNDWSSVASIDAVSGEEDASSFISMDSCASTSSSSAAASCQGELLPGIGTDVDAKMTSSSAPSAADAANASFATLRFSYLLVTLVIMLADGLQGTHLYILYEGYGFSVASLYCLGFFTGGLLTPITGPLVDKMGRKKAAMLYCALEILINSMEQYPYLPGLIASRMIGGFTTNLLHSVFETWLDTEYRARGLCQEKYEIVMRDAVIVSNLAAIGSGYLSHLLADSYGAIGPFRGAVTCTLIALLVVACAWTENYGSSSSSPKDTDKDENGVEQVLPSSKGILDFLKEATNAFRADDKMLRVGILQGLSAASLHIFVFLWSPTLIGLASRAPKGTWGLDSNGKPAFGLIFGAFMSAGVLGGLAAPTLRRATTTFLTPHRGQPLTSLVERPMAVEFLAACCYMVAALALFVPCMVARATYNPEAAFARALSAFLCYEFIIGVFSPCEGVIRSLYFPKEARASVLTLPHMIVNVAASLSVVSTNFISLTTAFAVIAFFMMTSAVLQLSLISKREWQSIFHHVDNTKRLARRLSKRLSTSFSESMHRRRSTDMVSCPGEDDEDDKNRISAMLVKDKNQ